MKKALVMQRLYLVMSTLGILGFSANAAASGFQLWEQDGASIGNYHAGRAAEAADASIGYYNPAGLVRIPNKELVVGVDPILTSFKYDGTIQVNTLGPESFPVESQGGTFNAVPDLHYAFPVKKNLVLGLSIVSPFGLKTDYGDDTFLRYAATLTSLQIIDIAPAIGFAFNSKWSAGLGLDLEHAKGEFDLVATAFDPVEDTQSTNTASSNAVGFHAGLLYQCSEQTRFGLSYHSKIVHHLDGESEFEGPLANNAMGGVQTSEKVKGDLVLPATTTLSAFHTINPRWDVMGTVVYTQWDAFEDLTLHNVAGIENGVGSNDIVVVIPENYHNTWNYSIGANYHLSQQWMFRTGIGYDQTPTTDDDRNAQLPDQSRVVLAIGGHYQATRNLGFDLGWSHYFVLAEADINNVTQPVGDQTTVTNANVKGSADVYGLQMKWDIV